MLQQIWKTFSVKWKGRTKSSYRHRCKCKLRLYIFIQQRLTHNFLYPHQNTMTIIVKGQPRFTDKALKMLTSKCQQHENHEIICVLGVHTEQVDCSRTYIVFNYDKGKPL